MGRAPNRWGIVSKNRGSLVRQSAGSRTNLTWRRPLVILAPEADSNKEVAQFDARAKRTAQLQDAVAASKPPQHRRFIGHLLSVVKDSDPKESGVGLGGDAMDLLAKERIQTVALDGRRDELGLDILRQGQRITHRTETYRARERDGN